MGAPRWVPPQLRPISAWGQGGFKPSLLSLQPMALLVGSQRPWEWHVSWGPHRSTLPLPPLPTLKDPGGGESSTGADPHPQMMFSNFSTNLLNTKPCCGSGSRSEGCGVRVALVPFLEISPLMGRGCGVKGMNPHPRVLMLGLGTAWLCNHGLAAPSHSASFGSCNLACAGTASPHLLLQLIANCPRSNLLIT